MTQTFWILVSILAGILLGTVSNWLFELLKGKIFPDKPNTRGVVVVVVFTLTVTIFLTVSQSLAQNDSTGSSSFVQSTFVALGNEQLAIQKQIATAQSDIATAQAGNVSDVDATAIAARLIDLSSTQAALAIEATRIASGVLSPTPIPSSEKGSQQVDPKDGMILLFVPAGHFLMGSGIGSDVPEAEKPQHRVYLDDFWIDQTEVTIGMFERFVDATGHATTAEINGYGYIWTDDQWQTLARAYWWDPDGDGLSDDANLPVSQVSWHDADAYCTWAGRRLPTEVEIYLAERSPFHSWAMAFGPFAPTLSTKPLRTDSSPWKQGSHRHGPGGVSLNSGAWGISTKGRRCAARSTSPLAHSQTAQVHRNWIEGLRVTF